MDVEPLALAPEQAVVSHLGERGHHTRRPHVGGLGNVHREEVRLLRESHTAHVSHDVGGDGRHPRPERARLFGPGLLRPGVVTAAHPGGEGNGRQTGDPALAGGSHGAAGEEEGEAVVEAHVDPRDHHVRLLFEERVNAQLGAVGRESVDGVDLHAVPLDALDPDVLPAADRLSDPAAFPAGNDGAHRPPLRERPNQCRKGRGIDAVVVGDEDEAHPASPPG